MRFAVLAAILAASPAVLAQEAEPTGSEIVARAYEAAGGEEWINPRSLLMEGYGLFWRGGIEPVRYEPYRMWRVYPEVKDAAHAADGRVRIEAERDGQTVFLLTFDGTNTYNQNGIVEGEAADSSRWASNFGFGVIRHALDDGYSVDRLPDDSIDGREAYTVRVNDPAGGQTLFNVAMDDHAILRVAFDTPEGWHERYYSDFYTQAGTSWVQPGRVRLYYNGVKANEIWWTSFTLNEDFDEGLFRVE